MEIGVVSNMIDLEKRMEGGVPPLVVMDRVPQRHEEKRDRGHFPSENNGSTTGAQREDNQRKRFHHRDRSAHRERSGRGPASARKPAMAGKLALESEVHRTW